MENKLISERLENTREEEEEKKLEIASISSSEYRSGILIPNFDFDKLTAILGAYECGVTNTSEHEGATSFVTGIVQAVKKAFNEDKDHWSKNYDYDGKGMFLKASVHVEFDRKNNVLILGINAATYGGKRNEEKLVQDLNLERAVKYITVNIELPEMADQDLSVPLDKRQSFRLDCAPLATAINSVIKKFGNPQTQYTPADLVQAFIKTDKYGQGSGDSFRVDLNDDIILTLAIHGGRRFVQVSGEKNFIDTRTAEESTLVLPFPTGMDVDTPCTNFEDPPQQIKNYSITVSLTRKSEDPYLHLPLDANEQLGKARAVAEHIKSILGTDSQSGV